MVEIKDVALSAAFLTGIGAEKEVEDTFSQEDRDLFYSWFIANWDDAWDREMTDYHINIIRNKINELKEMKE